MPRRFHAEPMVRATECCLQERLSPDAPLVQPHGDEAARAAGDAGEPAPHEPAPDHAAHAAAAHPPAVQRPVQRHGHQRRRRLQHLARPRRDPLARGPHPRRLGPVLLHPRPAHRAALVGRPISRCAATPTTTRSSTPTDKAEFRRVDGAIETHLEITVSPENHAEVRRLTLTNHDSRPHDLELTSYVEVVLAPHAADLAHPAFGKLFLETEAVLAAAAPAVPAPAALRPNSSRSGPSTSWPSTGRPWASCSTRRTGSASSAAAARRPTPPPWTPGAVLSGTTGAGARSDFQPALPGARARRRPRCTSRSPRRWPTRARRRWRWPTTTTTSTASRAPSSWPGRTARSSCGTCT